MSQYRIHFLDDAGRFIAGHEIEARTDGDALLVARRSDASHHCQV